jgi:hypothetical protein
MLGMSRQALRSWSTIFSPVPSRLVVDNNARILQNKLVLAVEETMDMAFVDPRRRVLKLIEVMGCLSLEPELVSRLHPNRSVYQTIIREIIGLLFGPFAKTQNRIPLSKNSTVLLMALDKARDKSLAG